MVPKVRKQASKEYRIILKARKPALKDWLVLKSSEMASCPVSNSQIWTYAFYFLFKGLYEHPSNCFVQLVCALSCLCSDRTSPARIGRKASCHKLHTQGWILSNIVKQRVSLSPWLPLWTVFLFFLCVFFCLLAIKNFQTPF